MPPMIGGSAIWDAACCAGAWGRCARNGIGASHLLVVRRHARHACAFAGVRRGRSGGPLSRRVGHRGGRHAVFRSVGSLRSSPSPGMEHGILRRRTLHLPGRYGRRVGKSAGAQFG